MTVVLHKKVIQALKKLPQHVTTKLYAWTELVEHSGIAKARRIPGFHDEPLKGKRKGQRSIRLSKSYRAIYVQTIEGRLQLIEVIEVNKHEY